MQATQNGPRNYNADPQRDIIHCFVLKQGTGKHFQPSKVYQNDHPTVPIIYIYIYMRIQSINPLISWVHLGEKTMLILRWCWRTSPSGDRELWHKNWQLRYQQLSGKIKVTIIPGQITYPYPYIYTYIYIYTVYTCFLYPHISDYIFLCTQTVSKHRNPLFTSMRLPHCIPIISHYSYVICWFTRGSTYKKLLKMAIEIVDLPIENGDFP